MGSKEAAAAEEEGFASYVAAQRFRMAMEGGDSGGPLDPRIGAEDRLRLLRTRHTWRRVVEDCGECECAVEGLSPSTEYVFRVRARNAVGWGPFGMASFALKTRRR